MADFNSSLQGAYQNANTAFPAQQALSNLAPHLLPHHVPVVAGMLQQAKQGRRPLPVQTQAQPPYRQLPVQTLPPQGPRQLPVQRSTTYPRPPRPPVQRTTYPRM